MTDRKTIKQKGRRLLKRHYVLLVVLCAVMVFLGTEYSGVVEGTQMLYEIVTRQTTLPDPDVSNLGLALEGLLSGAEKTEQETSEDASEEAADTGVLAVLVKHVDFEDLTVMVLAALLSLGNAGSLSAVPLILGGLALGAAAWIFARNDI